MTSQAGWYDDPQDDSNLRYWDGVQWTSHTSPKVKPGLERAGQAAAQAGGDPSAQGSAGATAQSNPWGQQPAHNPYAGQTGQNPYQGQWQGAPMPGGYQGDPARPTTPDGQPLASWGMRLLARILDGLLVGIVGGVIATLLMPEALSDYWDWALTVDQVGAQPPAQLLTQLTQWGLVISLVGLVYEVLMLTLVGATLGKLATGLRVRLRDQPGHLGWGYALVRTLVYQLLGIFTPLAILNGLWPLWDDKRQGLHDKAARSNVVRKG